MSKGHLFCAAILSVILSQAPVAAFAGPQAETSVRAVSACLVAANQPITRKSQYQNGSPRQREVLNNAYAPGVSAAKTACRALNKPV